MRAFIITHGGLADELVRSAEKIAGTQGWLKPITLDWNESFESARERVGEALAADGDDRTLLLTDLYGSTPFNVATSFFESGKVEVLSGVNLPMVVRLVCGSQPDLELADLVLWLQEKSRGGICQATERNGRPDKDES